MTGHVERLHVLLPVTFRQPDRPDFDLPFVVDTGFTGDLTLPVADVEALGLLPIANRPATLADGTETEIAVHEATIVWQGELRTVDVLALGERPLLGTALLDGYELVVQFAEGGLVTVEPL